MSGQLSATNMKAAFGVAAAITTSPAGLPAQFLTATKRGGTQRRSRGFAASSLVVSIAARKKASIISPPPEAGHRYSAQPGCCTLAGGCAFASAGTQRSDLRQRLALESRPPLASPDRQKSLPAKRSDGLLGGSARSELNP